MPAANNCCHSRVETRAESAAGYCTYSANFGNDPVDQWQCERFNKRSQATALQMVRPFGVSEIIARTNMKLAPMNLLIAGVISLFARNVLAQQTISRTTEFITSSSPLPDGSIVTTTYFPKSGTNPETRWTPGTEQSGSAPNSSNVHQRPEQSVLQASPQSLPTMTPATFDSRPVVETAQLPRTETIALAPPSYPTVVVPNWGNPFAGPRRYLPPNYQPVGYNVSTPQITTGYLPQGTVYPYPVASTVPTLNGPTVVPPAAGNPGSTRVNYQPILKFQNMPPGTYLGQGFIGQPTAYVDGQPLRNLLRYIFP